MSVQEKVVKRAHLQGLTQITIGGISRDMWESDGNITTKKDREFMEVKEREHAIVAPLIGEERFVLLEILVVSDDEAKIKYILT